VTTGRGVARLAGLLLSSVVVVGACGSSTTTGSPGTLRPSATVAGPGTGTASSPAPVATATPSRDPGASGLVVDAELLRVLPATVDGVALEADPATAAQIASDPSLTAAAEAIAVALAIRPGSSNGDDLAIVSVIRLRPGVFSDAWFETWRATYDESACDVAGGVKGTPKQLAISGRTVFVGTCAGDAATYHVHLADPTLIVSITAAGPARFGELVMAGLAE
jgi:hypothetical protein